jgi:PAS domain S-box-containing protein
MPSPDVAATLRRLPLFILEPAAFVVEPAERRYARNLAAILLILSVPTAAATRWHWLDARFVPFLYLGLILFGVAFFLNRYGHSRIAGGLMLAWLWVIPVVRIFTQQNQVIAQVNPILPDAVVSLIVAYLLFAPRVVVWTFLVNTFALLLSPTVNPQFGGQELLFALFFLFTASALMMVAAALRKYDQAQLAEQSRAVHASEERYRTLFESTFEAILVYDRGLLIDANPAFETLFGYELEDAVGLPLNQFVTPADQAVFRAYMEAHAAGVCEVCIVRQDGRLLQVEMLDHQYPDGEHSARVLAVRDITERKQAQAEHLELSMEHEKRKMLLRLMSNISHDLRTPLTVIKTGVYLLKRLMHDPEQRQKQIDVLESQVDELQRLMDDMLNLSRIDRGDTGEFQFRIVNMNDVLTDLLEEHRALAARKNQTLSFTPQSEVPPVLVDDNQIKRLFKHLLRNAVNYTPEQGSITLETGSEGEDLLVRVCDTGSGIEPDDMPYIFDYFFRADSARNSDRGGVGLGLTIARKIAEAHGGNIEVASTPGSGSTFTVRLPSAHVNAARRQRIH